MSDAEPGAPSSWLVRWAHLLDGRRSALDIAAGSGRHVRWLAAAGLQVTAVDRDAAAAAQWPDGTDAIVADIERGAWPLTGRCFDLVVVTNYLWRPLLPSIVECVAPGGLLLYETFAAGQERIGRPTNPDFLLRRGELLQATASLVTIAFEAGFVDSPARFVQRIAAFREDPAAPAARPPLERRAAGGGR